jgi:hypothetical protein
MGGTYQESVIVMVQFLGTITHPPNIALPGMTNQQSLNLLIRHIDLDIFGQQLL